MNWGHKIIIVYGVFVGGMILLAYKSSRQNTELVTDDYYAKELVYQQRIDQSKRTALLSAPVQVLINDRALSIHFPKDFAAKKISGNLTVYCPSNEKKDIHQQFSVTDSEVNVTLPANYKGLHYIKLTWETEGVNYYFEQKVII